VKQNGRARWVCCVKSGMCHLLPLAQRQRSLNSIVPRSHETFTFEDRSFPEEGCLLSSVSRWLDGQELHHYRKRRIALGASS